MLLSLSLSPLSCVAKWSVARVLKSFIFKKDGLKKCKKSYDFLIVPWDF